MAALTIPTFWAICRQVVADMGYTKGKQINSFVIMEEAPNLDASSFGRSYADYLSGQFYARSWVNQGADQNAILGEFPVLFTELLPQVTMPDLHVGIIQASFGFVLVDKIICQDCPPGVKGSGVTAQLNVLEMLRNFAFQVRRYVLYEVERDDVTTYEWAVPERMEADTTADVFSTIDNMVSFIQTEDYTFTRWGNFGITGMTEKVAYSLILGVDICEPAALEPNYQQAKVPGIGTIICC